MDAGSRLVVGNGLLVGTCLYGASDIARQWLADEIGEDYGATGLVDTAIGVISCGKLAGAIGFSGWRQQDFDIQISAAFRPGVPSRDAVSQAMEYAFEQLGCKRVTAVCVGGNEKGNRFAVHYGFKREGTLRGAHRGSDSLIIYRLTPAMWARGLKTSRTYNPVRVAYSYDHTDLRVVRYG